jgi:hypothetical protein
VPSEIKSRVWTTWRALRHYESGTDLRAAIDDYEKARADAIASVAEAERPLQ